MNVEVELLPPITNGVGKIANELAEEHLEAYQSLLQSAITDQVDISADQCVDGRPCKCNKDSSDYAARLHVAGGGATTTYASRLILGKEPKISEYGFSQVIQLADKRGFGGHARDCGAAANLPKILQILEDNAGVIASLRTALLLRDTLEWKEIFYSPTTEVDGDWEGAKFIDEGLAAIDPAKVQELVDGQPQASAGNHGHQEIGFAFVFDRQLGSSSAATVDQNKLSQLSQEAGFNADTFVVDVQRLKQLADFEAGTNRNTPDWLKTYSAMLDFQLATGLTLTSSTKQLAVVDIDFNN